MGRGDVGCMARAAQRASDTRMAAISPAACGARDLARTGGGRQRGREAVAVMGAPGPATGGWRADTLIETALKWKQLQ
eukprot:462193-Pleurochrysis_carterae.AAC.1